MTPKPSPRAWPSSLRRLTAACGVLAAVACEGKLGHRQEGVFQGRAPLPAEVQDLLVEVDFGSITLLADDTLPDAVTFEGSTLRAADDATVLRSLAAIDLTLQPSTEGSSLRLRPPPLPAGIGPAVARLVVRGIVRCPPRLRVTVRTGIGSLKVDGLAADVDLHTGQGEIVATGCRGRAALHTERGDILVDRHQGALDVQAPHGSARAFLAELGPAGVRAGARDQVEVHLPRRTGFTLSGATGRGRCHNSFGLPITIDGDRASMEGAANGGGPPLHLRSARGAVTVGVVD